MLCSAFFPQKKEGKERTERKMKGDFFHLKERSGSPHQDILKFSMGNVGVHGVHVGGFSLWKRKCMCCVLPK